MGKNTVATCDDYSRICVELGCQPVHEFLTFLQNPNSLDTCTINSLTSGSADDDQRVYALAAILPYTHIRELVCCHAELTGQAMTALLDGCRSCKYTYRIAFKACRLKSGVEDAHSVVGSALGDCQVESLDLSATALSKQLVDGLVQGQLLQYDGLQNLCLASCSLQCDEAVVLGRALEGIGLACSLVVLDLRNNKIGDRGALALANMLAGDDPSASVPLHALHLDGNQIHDVGGMALAKAAKNAVVLQTLNLGQNPIGNPTITACADALRFSGTLKELGVASQCVAEDAAVSLLRVAACSPSVRSLDLRGVKLYEKGAQEAAALLRNTGTLSTLLIEVATEEAAHIVLGGLKSNTTVTTLVLGDMPEHILNFIDPILVANADYSNGAAPGYSMPLLAKISTSPHLRSKRQTEAAGNTVEHNGLPVLLPSNTPVFAAGESPKRTHISSRMSSPERLSNEGLSSGGTSRKAADIFRRYDMDNNNYLDQHEMLVALCDLGVLDGMSARRMGKVLTAEMKKADLDSDGRISLQEFLRYYGTMAKLQTTYEREGRIRAYHQPQAVPPGYENNKALQRCFQTYCWHSVGKGRLYGESPRLNSAQFYQLCKDGGFLEPRGPLCLCAVDIIFARSKPLRSRRLGFREFLEALAILAQELRWSFDQVAAMLTSRCMGQGEANTQQAPKRSRSTPRQPSRAHSPSGASSVASSSHTRSHRPSSGSRPGSAHATAGSLPSPDTIQDLMSQVRRDTMSEMSQQMQAREDVWLIRLAALEGQLQRIAGGNPARPPSRGGVGGGRALHSPRTQQRITQDNPLFDNAEAGGATARPYSAPGFFHEGERGARGGGRGDAMPEAKQSAAEEMDQRLAALESYHMGGPAGQEGCSLAGGGGNKHEVLARVAALEAQAQEAAVARTGEVLELRQHVAALQQTVEHLLTASPHGRQHHHAQEAALGAKVEGLKGAVRSVSEDVAALRLEVARATKSSAPLSMAQHLQSSFQERQHRMEGALMQVAKKVDELDLKLKDDRGSSVKALDSMISSRSSLSISAGMY